MKQTQYLDFYDFKQRFVTMGRANEFTENGLHALYNHFTKLETETSEEIEVDVVAICCEYTEFTCAVDAVSDNGLETKLNDMCEEDTPAEERERLAKELLNQKTTVIEGKNGCIIVVNF